MVIDRIENLKKYIEEDDMQKIQAFLNKLSPEMEEGRYEIDGDKRQSYELQYISKGRL